MLASELIKKLQEFQEEFGDLDVKIDMLYSDQAETIDFLYLDSNKEETQYWFSIRY